MHRLGMQTVLSSPALPCPALLGGVSTVTLVSARAQLSSPGSCQSNPLLGAASPWQWDPQSSRSSIDLDGLKLHRVSHFHLLSAHPLEKRTGEAAEMCYSMALFNTDISVVDLLGSYKIFSSFSRATRTVLGHREQQMDLQWEQLPCWKHRHKEQVCAETLIEFCCQKTFSG